MTYKKKEKIIIEEPKKEYNFEDFKMTILNFVCRIKKVAVPQRNKSFYRGDGGHLAIKNFNTKDKAYMPIVIFSKEDLTPYIGKDIVLYNSGWLIKTSIKQQPLHVMFPQKILTLEEWHDFRLNNNDNKIIDNGIDELDLDIWYMINNTYN